ncbi:hypothetical protein GCM10029964_005040 [Kibdelosporangium lantanae]
MEVVAFWKSVVTFVQRDAPRLWAAEMVDEKGIPWRNPPFFVPAAAEHLPVDAKARYLADAEHRRLVDAELYHLDAEATAIALATPVASSPDVIGLAPAPSGLLVWETPIPAAARGPIVAVSWGPVEDGGMLTTWWSERHGQLIDAGWARDWPGTRPDRAHLPVLPYVLDQHVTPATMATWTAVRALPVEVDATGERPVHRYRG